MSGVVLGGVAEVVSSNLGRGKIFTASIGSVSSIPDRYHTFMEIDHEINSTAILLSSADSRRVVSYKRKYEHEVLVNRLVKLAQKKSDLTVPTLS